MKHARIAYAGAIHRAVAQDDGLLLQDGRTVDPEHVVWLPPLETVALTADPPNNTNWLAPEPTVVARATPAELTNSSAEMLSTLPLARPPE